MRRRWLVAVLSAALLVPAPALGQGTSIVDPLDGVVLLGQEGETDDLELTETELIAATRRVEELHAGIVTPDPSTAGPEAEQLAAIVDAATERLETAGMIVDECLVGPEQTADDCIAQHFAADALAVLTIGDFGDLTATTEVLIRNRVIVVGVGGSTLAERAVTLEVDPVTAATAQGKAAGRSLAVALRGRTGNALIVAANDPRRDDPVRVAAEGGLRQTARKVKIVGREGPAEVHTVEDLEALMAGLPKLRVAIGEGLLLDGVDSASLDRLPAAMRLITWDCSGSVTDVLDVASRLRGCVARAEDTAGEAAANVVLSIKTGRDVPASIEIPVYVYRGTVPVGPGSVELGRRFTRTSPAPTEQELSTASGVLAGRTVGIVVPVEPGSRETEEQRLIRTGVEDSVMALGATVETCIGAKSAARTCVDDLVAAGVAAIVPIATHADLSRPATAAVNAGIPVIGVNELLMGDSGAIYVIVSARSVGRLTGRMAGAYADRIWKGQPVEAVVFNDSGARANDGIASAVERALVQTDDQVSVVARLASESSAEASAAVRTLLRRYPSTRILVGSNAASAAPILIKKKNVNPGLVIFAQDCDPDVVAAIDAGVDTGGRIKGCVDRNAAGAGRLAGEVLARLAAGSTVPEIIEVPVVPYEPGAR